MSHSAPSSSRPSSTNAIVHRLVSVKDFDFFNDWRSVESGRDHAFGRQTVVFGPNGSGKSSIGRIFAAIEQAQTETKPFDRRLEGVLLDVLDRESEEKRSVRGDDMRSLPQFAVFNSEYIRKNLRPAFEQGEVAAALYVLGEKNIKLDEKVLEAEALIGRCETDVVAAREATQSAKRSLDNALDRVRERVADLLGPYDYSRFNKTKFNKMAARKLVNQPGKRLTDVEFAAAQKELTRTEHDIGSDIEISAPPSVEALVQQAEVLANFEVTARAIDRLQADSELGRWAHAGLALHEGAQTCGFCDSSLTEGRLDALRAHFDDSYEELQHLIESVGLEKDRVEVALMAVSHHLRKLENESDAISESVQAVQPYLASLQQVADSVGETLQARIQHPLTVVRAPTWPHLSPSAWTGLEYEVAQENKKRRELRASIEESRGRACDRILDHLASEYYAEINIQTNAMDNANTYKQETAAALDSARRELAGLKSKTRDGRSGTELAIELTRDLASYLGHESITVQYDDDGTQAGFRFYRDGAAAKHLSEGECNAIALLHFLRSLETHEVQPRLGGTCVVIDDPVSSLDDDSTLSALAFIRHRLLDRAGRLRCGQLIVLTHSFRFFRAWKDVLSSQRSKDIRAARDRQLTVEALGLRRTTLLEVRARTEWQADQPALRRPLLQERPADHPLFQSEYHVLFSGACEALENDDPRQLIVAGNMARRLLESFLRFKQPKLGGWRQALDSIVDRLNLHEGSVPGLQRLHYVLDDESHLQRFDFDSRDYSDMVLTDVRAALALIKAADPGHFEGMCEVVGLQPAI